MEPIDYIKTFKMAEENFQFNRNRFFNQFKEEFLDYLNRDTLGLDAEGKRHCNISAQGINETRP